MHYHSVFYATHPFSFCFPHLLPRQVLEVVRSNYDTLTLKLQDGLDQFERYSEQPKEAAFFKELVREEGGWEGSALWVLRVCGLWSVKAQTLFQTDLTRTLHEAKLTAVEDTLY